jgi:ATP-dependent Clp endopeptidase proteolytic subunit ClpP
MSNAIDIADDEKQPSISLDNLRHQLARKATIEADAAEQEWKRMQASKDEAHIYSFLDPVVLESTQNCMDVIGQWYREDPERPIEIVLNSPGGAVIHGLALVDFITELRAQGAHIDIVILGMAASMAAVIAQAAERRIMGKHAYMMIHEVSSAAIGSMSEIQDTAKFTERLQDRILDLFASRANVSRDEIKEKWERKDWWMDANEAVTAGFADEVR